MRLLVVVLAGLLPARMASAQAVSGRVVGGGDSSAVAGAIVTLIDSADTRLARALTDDMGRFVMRMPAPGRYRVEALRIGFVPTLDEPFRVGRGDIVSRTVRLTGRAVPLDTLRANVGEGCIGRDSAARGAAVWEEVRKALMASQLTRATRAYTMDVELFSNRQTSDVHVPPTVRRSARYSSSLRSFRTRPAERFAAAGYLERHPAGDVYFAPDEEVLLSPSFTQTHCLSLLPDSGSAGIVRLGFAPVPGRRLPDIRGVFSVDRATSELRGIEFAFVNLRPAEQAGSPGGELAFRRLPEGSWIIEYWAIGVPYAETRVAPDEPRPAPGRTARQLPPPPASVLLSTGRITTGGGVARVLFGDTVVWRAGAPVQPRIRVPLPPR